MLGIDALARQDHLHRVAEPDDHRQADQAAVAGVKAPLAVLQRELGIGGAKPQVAGQRQLEAAGDGIAVDGGEDRLVDVEATRNAAQTVALDPALAELGRRRRRKRHRVGFQIGAGAKG